MRSHHGRTRRKLVTARPSKIDHGHLDQWVLREERKSDLLLRLMITRSEFFISSKRGCAVEHSVRMQMGSRLLSSIHIPANVRGNILPCRKHVCHNEEMKSKKKKEVQSPQMSFLLSHEVPSVVSLSATRMSRIFLVPWYRGYRTRYDSE